MLALEREEGTSPRVNAATGGARRGDSHGPKPHLARKGTRARVLRSCASSASRARAGARGLRVRDGARGLGVQRLGVHVERVRVVVGYVHRARGRAEEVAERDRDGDGNPNARA